MSVSIRDKDKGGHGDNENAYGLLLTSVLASLSDSDRMAQHVDVNPGGIQVQGGGHGPAVVRNVAIAVTMNVGKGSTRSGVKATTAADTMKSGTKSV